MNGKTYTREFKLQVVRQIERGEKRAAQVCREYGLATGLVSRWRKEYVERGEAAFATPEPTETVALVARIAELERFCGQLALENEVLKKGLKRSASRSDMP